jgi:hypothetical protein
MLENALFITALLVGITLMLRHSVMMRDIKRAGMSERLMYSADGRKFSMNLAELHREVRPRSKFRRTMRTLLWIECSVLVLLVAMKLLKNVSPGSDHVPPPPPAASSSGKAGTH